MISLYTILVSCLFSVFVFLDLVSHVPRLSGSILGLNGLGFAFQTMANTIKRIFLVLIPPALGLVAVRGEPVDVFVAIFASHVLATLSFVIVFLMRQWIIDIFCSAIRAYEQGNGIVSSFSTCFKGNMTRGDHSSVNIVTYSVRRDIFLSAIWIFFFYTSSGFLINIFALIIPEYSFVILQLTGVINALGTLVLAFFLDPRISRIYEKGEGAGTVYISLFLAQFFNVVIVSPFFYFFLFLGFS